MVRNLLRVLATALSLTSGARAAEGGAWSVSKSSGEVWITSAEVQQASVSPEDNFKPGDTIRTGRNGRVLLVRGQESILIAANSVVELPPEQKEDMSTTIVQRAGSILLEVEKRNVKHFEVETPTLAAVVKGTQFRVSVNAASTRVDVIRGQVEVADFKSGQIAQVMPGQRATTVEHGKPGLSLSGSGVFNPIEQGKPRPSTIDRVPVPKGGLSAPHNATNGQAVYRLASIDRTHGGAATTSPQLHRAVANYGGVRISSALGEVKLDFHKATNGLARGTTAADIGSRSPASTPSNNTVWNSSAGSSATATASASTAASSALSNPSALAAAVATNSGNGKGNGANGNGVPGKGKGPEGNGNGPPGNGNDPHGNGNGPPGNGNDRPGHGKH